MLQMVRKLFYRLLYFLRFIIDETKNKRILEDIKQLKVQDKGLQKVDKDGRYPCRANGCSMTFAHNGKQRRDHEANHSPPVVIPDVSSNYTLNVEPPLQERDDMLCYQKAMLEYGMLLLNFWDAISEGDGDRILCSWKYFLLYLRNEEMSAAKYSLEALYLLCQVNAILSPQAAHRLIWNRTVKNKAGLGGNIPLDLQLEFYNKVLKSAVRNLGPNTSKKSLDRICHAMGVTNKLRHNFDKEIKMYKRSGRHIKPSLAGDMRKLVNELVVQKELTLTPGRQYNWYKNMKPSLLHGFNSHKLYQWINEHKKNIIFNRCAR